MTKIKRWTAYNMPPINMVDKVSNKIAEVIADELDKKILESFLDEKYSEMQYDTHKQMIDTIYLHEVKKKVELLLDKIIKKFNLLPYLSEKKRYRLDENKWNTSTYKNLYDSKKDIKGNYLQYGSDYIPVDFEDWMKIYLPDYIETSSIYSDMCESRRVQKDDLKKLNKIAKQYIINDTDDENTER